MRSALGAVVLVVAAACGAPADLPAEPIDAGSTEAASTSARAPEPPPEPAPPPARRESLTLIAGGDVSFGRGVGQRVLKRPDHDPFAPVAALLAAADVRFANLESQLSDQKGETQSPRARLVFTGPPGGADALARAGFTVVSTANNHAWDYGKKALLETLDNLERTGVAHVGTGRDIDEAERAVRIDKDGFRIAILAVTDIWNFGPLSKHKAAAHVARADERTLADRVRAARADPDIDAVIVSHHGGVEYVDLPIPRTRRILRAAIDAGADAVIGHHPHVVQGVEWYRGKPIFYSLGNFVMEMSEGHVPAPTGMLARLVLRRGGPLEAFVCPLVLTGSSPAPARRDAIGAAATGRFLRRFGLISKGIGGTSVGEPGEDGCAPLSPPLS